jgi:hypothetical protein
MTKLFTRIESGENLPMLDEYFDDCYESDFCDETLVGPRKEFLNQLVDDDILDVTFRDEYYYDDHELCAEVDITFESGDVLSISAMWISVELVAAFMYFESKKAKSTIIDYLTDTIQNGGL